VRPSRLSKSFHNLLDLARSFDRIPSGRAVRSHLVRQVEALGSTSVPLLVRKMRSGSDDEAAWAEYLLARAGSERAISALRQLCEDREVAPARRMNALALLAELGAPVRATLRPIDGAGIDPRAAEALVDAIAEPADVAQLADRLVAQVDPVDLVPVLRRLAAARGGAIAGLLDEMLLREELWSGAKRQLVALRERLGEAPVLSAGVARIWASSDGAAIVAMRRGRGGRARRTLVVLLDADGALARVLYDAEGSAAFALPALRARLAAEGHILRRTEVRAVSARVAEAARRARAGGERLPRGYHLGRDLVGLDDEHAAPPAPAAAPQLLARGTAHLEAGDPSSARPLLGAFVAVVPEDAEARTWLSCALMALQQPAAALPHLRAAVRLEPEDPVRWWNLAAAARQADKHGASYLALGDFLRRVRGRRTPARRRAALRYRRLYEQMVAREHPGVRAREMARAEDLFDRACDALDAGRAAEAVRGFEAVLALVPSHHPSWSNLGAAYTQLDRRGDARRCLERALACRPGYDVAERNLQALDRS